MKILVTGATGGLGINLTEKLVSTGYIVTATGRNVNIGSRLINKGARFLPSNIADIVNLDKAFIHQDIVFHCAALSSPWGRYKDFYNSNVLGTENVIKLCFKHDIKRLIHVSTPSIYFDFEDKFDIKEDHPLPEKPINYYVETKLIAEKLIDQAFKEGLDVITIRPRAIFGPHDNSLLPRLIHASINGRFPLIGGGENIVEITYVENVVDALILCLIADKAALGQKFNITNDQPIILKELLSKVFMELNIAFKPVSVNYNLALNIASVLEIIAKFPLNKNEPKLTRYSASVLAKSQTLNIDKAKNLLGYKPQITIDEGIKLYKNWWKSQNAS